MWRAWDGQRDHCCASSGSTPCGSTILGLAPTSWAADDDQMLVTMELVSGVRGAAARRSRCLAAWHRLAPPRAVAVRSERGPCRGGGAPRHRRLMNRGADQGRPAHPATSCPSSARRRTLPRYDLCRSAWWRCSSSPASSRPSASSTLTTQTVGAHRPRRAYPSRCAAGDPDAAAPRPRGTLPHRHRHPPVTGRGTPVAAR